MQIHFWGVRGTLPVPGKNALQYGGNTNCVTVKIADENLFIFDAGTGIKSLGDSLQHTPIAAHLFISHPHFDHIHGLPFFSPLYQKQNTFDIYGMRHGNQDMQTLLAGQMNSVYFPVALHEFAATLHFHCVTAGKKLLIGNVSVTTHALHHPGGSLGFRLDWQGKSFCYITDNELLPVSHPQFSQIKYDNLLAFLNAADVAVVDATYSDGEYNQKIGWGHSTVARAVQLAHDAHVKRVCLYHHDPAQQDVDITQKATVAKALLHNLQSKTRCIVPCEGDTLTVP